MIDLGPHAFFILTAYSGVALVTLAIIIMTIMGHIGQKKRLEELEAKGFHRRSEKKNPKGNSA